MNLESTSDKPEGKAPPQAPSEMKAGKRQDCQHWKLQKVPLSLLLNHEKLHSPPQVNFLSQVSAFNNKAQQNTLHLFLTQFTE